MVRLKTESVPRGSRRLSGDNPMKKSNPWAAKDREIAALKAQVEELRSKPEREAFWREVGNGITLIMATTPRSQWSEHCKAAFEWAAKKLPVTAYFVTENLKARGL
jgi:hypothetical protein